MPADSSGYSGRLDLVFVKDAGDDIRNIVEFHDLAVDDGVSLKVFVAETDELKLSTLLLKLNGLD
jgi:hypothetical protein